MTPVAYPQHGRASGRHPAHGKSKRTVPGRKKIPLTPGSALPEDWSNPYGRFHVRKVRFGQPAGRNAIGSADKGARKPAPPLHRYLDNTEEELRRRLANANDYFHRKASEVLNDEAALKLLAALYEEKVIDIEDIDMRESGIPLAKLTAANFCQIGAKVIYVTDHGYRFVDSIKDA